MYSYYKDVEKMVKSICEQDKTIKEKSILYKACIKIF